MKAFHNDPAVKEKYLARVIAHRKADEIVKGYYWENGKGCAVGCTVHSGKHSDYETELGIPRLLARIEDGIFEGLPNGKAKAWPEQFLSSINVGADLSRVFPVFMEWLLIDQKDGVMRFAKTPATRKAIQDIGDAFHRQSNGAIVQREDWLSLRAAADAYAAAAYAAAAYAADAAAAAAAAAAYAADAYAAYAAYAADAYAAAAAAAAVYAAVSAAADAAAAAAAADARGKARIRQSEKLIEILKAQS